MKPKRQKPASGSKSKLRNTRQPKAAKQRNTENYAWLDAIAPAFRSNVIRLAEAYKNEYRGFVAYDQMQWDRTERYLNLEFLRHYRSLPERRRVQNLICDIWDRRRPFCLYLRNFRFGTHYVGNIRPKIHGQEQPQTVHEDSFADQEMRRSLSKALSSRMPMLDVQNPLDTYSELSEIRFSDEEWKPRVRDLIRAARMIFLYLGRPSKGTTIEIDMIREEGRAGQTAVIIGSEKADLNLGSMDSMLTQKKSSGEVGVRPVKAEEVASLDDFAFVVAGNDISPRKLLSRLETKCAVEQTEPKFCGTPPLPSGRLVDSKTAKELVKIGMSDYVKGEAHQGRGESYFAESAFHSALAFFLAADDSRHLAPALLELGRTLLVHLHEYSRAADVLEWAVEIYEHLEVTEMIPSASQEYAMACVHADPPRLDEARAAIERAVALNSNNSDWGRFATYATIEEIEKKAGRGEAARAAVESALEAYSAYRRSGGEPQSVRARLVTAMYPDYRDQGCGDFGKFVTETKWLDQLPELRASLLEWCSGVLNDKEMLERTASLDERFELAILLGYVRQHASEQPQN